MDIKTAIKKVILHNDLSEEEMTDVMLEMMTGKATPSQIAAFLVALHMKGEAVSEITAAAKVMRQFVTPVVIHEPHLIDIVGTGGDMRNTFNISTTSAIIVAAAGGKVAKHGNRSISSQSGSADLLEYAGVNIDLNAEQVADCVAQIGIGFMFAPHYHSAMRFATQTRKEIGIRTLFNLLGPLSNPANAPHLMIGVYAKKLLFPIALTLRNLACTHALIIHSTDGLDEISLAAPSDMIELKEGQIHEFQIKPEDFGLKSRDIQSLCVNSAAQSFIMMQEVLNNERGVAKDIVLLNAGAAIYTAGLASSIQEGVDIAAQTLKNGSAQRKLQQLIRVTQTFNSQKTAER